MNRIIVSAAANKKVILLIWVSSLAWQSRRCLRIIITYIFAIFDNSTILKLPYTYSNFDYFLSNYAIALYQKEDCHASEMGDWSNADFINKCSERLFLCCTSRAILYYPLLKWHKTYIPSIIWCVKRKLSKQLHYMHKMFLQNHNICKCRKLWLQCRCSHIIRGYYFCKILRKVL